MASVTKNNSIKSCADNVISHSRHQSGFANRSNCCPSMYSNGEEDKAPATDIEDIIPLESVQLIAKQLLEAEQFFRLTIDLKKLKFVEPLQSRVIEDDDFVHSVSLSYLTAPLFQSSDVFHAIQIARNPKDPTELLISDGFCSFRFEDRLLWTDFARLFLPNNLELQGTASPAASSGAALPIFVRARQSPNEKKSTTIGVATLTFESFLSQEPPSVTDIPQSFYNNLISNGSNAAEAGATPPCDTKQCRELPIFEGLMKIPIITRESASIVGLLTLGVAIDLMLNANELSLLLSKSLHRVTPLHPIKSFIQSDITTLPTDNKDTSPPPSPSYPLTITETCRTAKNPPASNNITRHGGANSRLHSQNGRTSDWKQRLFHRKSQTGVPLRDRSRSSSKRTRGVSGVGFGSDSAHTSRSKRTVLPSATMRRREDSPCSSVNEEEECSGEEDDIIPNTAPGPSNLLQMEMLLMKLSAEQAHQKFREEIRLAEKKAEEKVAEIKAENQKLKSENQSLESKLADLEKKFHGLQKSIESAKSDSPSRKIRDPYKTGSDRSTSREPNIDTIDELRRQNERLLQLLLRQSSQNHQPPWHPACPNISPADFQQMMAPLSPPRTRNGNADLSVEATAGRPCVGASDPYMASQLAQASSMINNGSADSLYVASLKHVPSFVPRHRPASSCLTPALPYTMSAPSDFNISAQSQPSHVTRQTLSTFAPAMFVTGEGSNAFSNASCPVNSEPCRALLGQYTTPCPQPATLPPSGTSIYATVPSPATALEDPFALNRQTSSWLQPMVAGENPNNNAAGLKACRETPLAHRPPPVPASTRQGRLPTRHNRNRSAFLSDAKGIRSSSSLSRPPSPPQDPDDRRTLHTVSSATCSKRPALLENRRSAGTAFPRNGSDLNAVECSELRPSPCSGGGGKASGINGSGGASKRMRSGSSSSSSSVSSSPLTSRSKQLLAELLKKGESS